MRQHTTDPPERSTLGNAAKGATGVVLITLVVAALIFSNSFAARRITENARTLGLSESVLGTNALALKSLSQALLLGEDLQLGVADAETMAMAVEESRRHLSDLADRTEALAASIGADGPELASAATSALERGATVADLIEQGDVGQAGELLAGDALGAFEGVRDITGRHQKDAAAGIETTSSLLSRLGSLPAFLVALLVPGVAILTYRRIAKTQLRVAEAQLDARLEAEHKIIVAKDEFVASISHELRTPLTTIYGFSEVLLDLGLIDPEHATELLTMINVESAELHRMVEDLLTTARAETTTLGFQLEPVDLSHEVATSVTSLQRTGLAIHVDLEVTDVWADAMRVRQIVRNLLSNAHKYGGDVVRVTSVERGAAVEIVVADDGDGVAPERLARLFTRYVHEGEAPLTVGSIGMGLAVVKTLAEGMGGSARYERSDGWSRFIVTLPRFVADGPASIAPRVDAPVTGMRIAATEPFEEGSTGLGGS